MCTIAGAAEDEALAACAKRGCRDCFSRLYERYRFSLARYLHESFRCDFDTALDLEAEAWKRAFQHLATYGGDRPFKAWILAIIRNLAVSRTRHLRRAPETGILARGVQSPPTPLDHLERRETAETCIRLVRGLSEELREPFFLRTVFDLDLRAIGELLGISTTTARGRLFRARKALAEAVRETR
jgi:RNA polymerase sigma-70 factor (ECF subfamily)